jgi:D-glycero-alpha-D-manno-heptose-7-phosphate kinase
MLIARAPLRISFAGGGTDLPAYYEEYGGAVVSTTINKYVYVHVSPNGKEGAQINSADYQTFFQHQLGQTHQQGTELTLPRAALKEFDIQQGISMFLASEVPPGTGLGSSSALTVALVAALAAHQGKQLSRQQVADTACTIELDRLGAPIGKQDQFAAAFGGLNMIEFTTNRVTVEPLKINPEVIDQHESRLVLFLTKTPRNSATILRHQQSASAQRKPRTVEGLHRIKAAALECRKMFESGNIDQLGSLLHVSWQEKRKLTSGITNAWIDDVYDAALKSGAIGGKILGAGGGGFLLLYCPEERQSGLIQTLIPFGLSRMPFHFERRGVDTTQVAWGTTDTFGAI